MPLNPEDFARYGSNKPSVTPASLIDKADELVDIRDIYTDMGYSAPSGEYSSWKIFCPFGDEHADGGMDKNCRLYPTTNNIYCWDSHGYLTSTRLYSRWKGIPRKKAAQILLEERGLLKRYNYREHWNELVDYREAQKEQSTGSEAYAVQALQMALNTDPRYGAVEFSAPVREAWTVVLEVLDVLCSREQLTIDQIQRWLDKAKARIQKAVDDASRYGG